jgi:hypothetical protein
LGKPDYPDPGLVYDLMAASCLKIEKPDFKYTDGGVEIRLTLSEQSAALVTVYY